VNAISHHIPYLPSRNVVIYLHNTIDIRVFDFKHNIMYLPDLRYCELFK